MSVGRICVREVDTAEADESVQVAAARMNARNVGTLLVLNEAQQPIGIVTDRDLAIKTLGQGRDPISTRVRDVMTRSPVSIREDATIEAALAVMRSGPYRRLPVVDSQERLVGLVSVNDILDLLVEEFNEIGLLLRRESPAALAANAAAARQETLVGSR